MFGLIALILLWHKPGGKGHNQKRHGRRLTLKQVNARAMKNSPFRRKR